MPEREDTVTVKASVLFRTIARFYNADDPSPEERRELSDRAEEQIFHEILDRPKGSRIGFCNELEILFPAADLLPGRSAGIISAIRSHFRLRSEEVKRDMRLTQRVGLREVRLTLAVCLPSFLGIAICSQFKGNPVAEVIENVLIIFCWVTIWQPFQSLVFTRWTLNETAKLYEKIAGMEISVRAV
jgi:hypothetical protein